MDKIPQGGTCTWARGSHGMPKPRNETLFTIEHGKVFLIMAPACILALTA